MAKRSEYLVTKKRVQFMASSEPEKIHVIYRCEWNGGGWGSGKTRKEAIARARGSHEWLEELKRTDNGVASLRSDSPSFPQFSALDMMRWTRYLTDGKNEFDLKQKFRSWFMGPDFDRPHIDWSKR